MRTFESSLARASSTVKVKLASSNALPSLSRILSQAMNRVSDGADGASALKSLPATGGYLRGMFVPDLTQRRCKSSRTCLMLGVCVFITAGPIGPIFQKFLVVTRVCGGAEQHPPCHVGSFRQGSVHWRRRRCQLCTGKAGIGWGSRESALLCVCVCVVHRC